VIYSKNCTKIRNHQQTLRKVPFSLFFFYSISKEKEKDSESDDDEENKDDFKY